MSAFVYQHSTGRQHHQRDIKRALNEYLFAEYDFDIADEAQISDNWPFELRFLETIQMPAGDVHVFEFTDEVETCFAIAGSSMTFYPTDGMTINELRLQIVGSSWIARQGPVDLNMIQISYDDIPSVRERRAAIEALAAQALPNDPSPRIREGLFLKLTGMYLALIQCSDSEKTVIVCSGIEPWPVALLSRSTWRKLSFGVGQMITEGRLQKLQRD